MDANRYLQQYLPDFDVEGKRRELSQFSQEDLVEMLIIAYKNVRIAAMMADVLSNKLTRIASIAEEPTMLPSVDMPPSNFPTG